MGISVVWAGKAWQRKGLWFLLLQVGATDQWWHQQQQKQQQQEHIKDAGSQPSPLSTKSE